MTAFPTINRLKGESNYRTNLVEQLRYAAELLRETRAPDAVGVAMRFETADRLLEAAAGLCEHCRVRNGRCRYCNAMVVEG